MARDSEAERRVERASSECLEVSHESVERRSPLGRRDAMLGTREHEDTIIAERPAQEIGMLGRPARALLLKAASAKQIFDALGFGKLSTFGERADHVGRQARHAEHHQVGSANRSRSPERALEPVHEPNRGLPHEGALVSLERPLAQIGQVPEVAGSAGAGCHTRERPREHFELAKTDFIERHRVEDHAHESAELGVGEVRRFTSDALVAARQERQRRRSPSERARHQPRDASIAIVDRNEQIAEAIVVADQGTRASSARRSIRLL